MPKLVAGRSSSPGKATDVSVEEWRAYRYRCPVEATLDVIGGRWKGVILYHLLEGPMRFTEFRRLFPAMTPRSLTLQLRELERDGVICREVYAQVPPRVEYSLTAHGRSLEGILRAMSAWGVRYSEPEAAEEGKGDARATEFTTGKPQGGPGKNGARKLSRRRGGIPYAQAGKRGGKRVSATT